ncbi:MAG: hypothetical protein ABI960_01095 [Candidatus Eisenbacteria bacterium]
MIVYSILGFSPGKAMAAAPLGEAWHDFYLMSGTAAATLVGLLFVALSLHVEILFRDEHQDFRELAAQAFQGYLYVLITALAFLLPTLDGRMLAFIYAAINLVMLVRTLARVPAFFAAHRARRGAARQPWRFFIPALAYVLGIVAVVEWMNGAQQAGIGFFTPVVMMLSASTRTAWDLLEYVGRARAAGAQAD